LINIADHAATARCYLQALVLLVLLVVAAAGRCVV